MGGFHRNCRFRPDAGAGESEHAAHGDTCAYIRQPSIDHGRDFLGAYRRKVGEISLGEAQFDRTFPVQPDFDLHPRLQSERLCHGPGEHGGSRPRAIRFPIAVSEAKHPRRIRRTAPRASRLLHREQNMVVGGMVGSSDMLCEFRYLGGPTAVAGHDGSESRRCADAPVKARSTLDLIAVKGNGFGLAQVPADPACEQGKEAGAPFIEVQETQQVFGGTTERVDRRSEDIHKPTQLAGTRRGLRDRIRTGRNGPQNRVLTFIDGRQ